MAELLDFTGKTVVITGAASGMGAATAALVAARGGDVHTIDVAPVSIGVANHRCDLGDAAAIDDVVGRLPDRVDSLMNCAGVPNGGRFTPEAVLRINWLGLRHLTESLLPRIPDGGSVVHIASTAGRDWAVRVDHHRRLMAARSFDEGLEWVKANPDVIGDGYAFSKEAVQYYTMWRAVQLLRSGVRMNSLCPGVTETAIVSDFRKGLGDELIDHAAAVAGRMAAPEEMAPTMLFLADHEAASYVNGVNVNVDRGTGAARATDQSDPVGIWGERPD
ncbi:MAG: coniferyl-alcohol dehydrogenase [Actinomycetota bacterium]